MLPIRALGQSDNGLEELLQELMETGEVDDEDDVAQWEEQAELLSYLHSHPMPLNTALRSELQTLPFLDENQVEAIKEYQAHNGPLHSWTELRLIRGLSLQAMKWLPLFCTLDTGEASRDKHMPADTVSHQLMNRLDVPLYRRQGWPWTHGMTHKLLYRGKYGRRLEWGARVSKDAGEPMLCKGHWLWDAYGGHLTLHNWRFLQTLIIGDFKAGWGEGLVVNNGIIMGKAALGWGRATTGLRSHRSTSETNFMRGVAATVAIGDELSVSAFYSFRHLDASLYKDGTVRSISTSGLHRTASEQSRKGNLGVHSSAFHANWHHNKYQIGLTALYQHYNRLFSRGSSLYRQITPKGYRFGAVSADYSYRFSPLLIAGETARSFGEDAGGLATLNRMTYQFSTDIQLSLLQRYYSRYYHSFLASAYRENTSVQNESGLAIQLDARTTSGLNLMLMADVFYAAWPRYSMSRSSNGWEGIVQASYDLSRRTSIILRYAIKSKEQSDQRHYSHRIRTTLQWQLGQHLTLRPTLHCHVYQLPDATSAGYAILPRADYTLPNQHLLLSLQAGWFSTDDWNSRIHAYEPSLYSTFGLQQLYGRGTRIATLLRYLSPSKRLHLQFKLGITHFTDRQQQSSGITLIDSPNKTDLQFLLKYNW
ncbi:MAG: hypothetical protein J5486_10895 [Bacteroidaceae bacterium]|nr:hypothetical protein [Bacteroidaceae bacterium]